MGILFDIPDELKRLWQSGKEPLQKAATAIDEAAAWPLNSIAGPGLLSTALNAVYPDSPKEGFVGGILNLAPGYIAANYRSPEMLQALRRRMAEENVSRGPMAQVGERIITREPGAVLKQAMIDHPEIAPAVNESLIDRFPAGDDPFSQILRGSWYHGMSDKAREAVLRNYGIERPTLGAPIRSGQKSWLDEALNVANETGFPLSLHDAQSISNKLGEPAGISLSVLPTKSQQFAADDYIHRVMPLYGGPPTQRTVNLMTPEGRAALNDAYDVVANKNIGVPLPRHFTDYYNLNPGSSNLDILKEAVPNTIKEPGIYKNMNPVDAAMTYLLSTPYQPFETGPFNKALSDQLQSQGYRGILYNPQRWNEYEILMLDPKYALPLDYRKVGEYIDPSFWYKTNKNLPGTKDATPGVLKGLDQIQDIMSQNKSRLGDIYAERPWTQRLSEENKQRLLELIDPNYREMVGNQLYTK